MSTTTKSRRRQVRHEVAPGRTAWVEFEHPAPHGRHHRLALTNLSSSGVSFAFGAEAELSGLDPGTGIPGVLVRVGDCMIYGDLLVMHVTPRSGTENVCGALFYPKSDGDLVKLKGVVAGMEAAGTADGATGGR
jgi:hypothetical protein